MARVALLLFWLASQAMVARGQTGAEIPIPVWFVPGQPGPGSPAFVAADGGYTAEFYPSRVRYQGRGLQLDMEFLGTSAPPILYGADPAASRVNFLTGSRRETGIQPFQTIYYAGLYPGIQARFTGLGGHLKYEFITAAHASPSVIRLRYRGAHRINLEADDSLTVTSDAGTWREAPPYCYQVDAAGQLPVACRFVLHGPDTIGFSAAGADPSLPLWIDPVLSFSTLVGNAGNSTATAVATDVAGSAYIAGYTDGQNLGGVAPARADSGGVEAAVLKISGVTQQIVYVTYLGGSGDDRAFGIQVDSAGNAYVTGWTTSGNFPTASASQGSKRGYKDAFVSKLNPSGSTLLFSTYFGGSGDDSGNAIALNATTVAIAGETQSADLTTMNPSQGTSGGRQDAFVVLFNISGALTGASHFGGSGDESGRAIAFLPDGSYVIGGNTDSPDLPLRSAFQSALRGSRDGFVAKFTGANRDFSTYLGGSGGTPVFPESVEAIAADSAGNIYLGGLTPSADFPTANALYSAYGGGDADGFLAKLSPSGSQLLVSTFLGGRGRDAVSGLSVAPDGAVAVVGSTSSANLPVLQPLVAGYRGGIDAFVYRFESTLSTVTFGTYLGGAGADAASGVSCSPDGDYWVAGQSTSQDFPTASPAQQPTGSSLRFFISRLAFQQKVKPVSVTPSEATGLAQTFTFEFTHPLDAAQIAGVQVLLANSWSPSRACLVQLLPGTSQVSLADDSGTTWSSALTGAAAILENSQCQLNVAGTSFTRSGKGLTVNVPLVFKPSFKGLREIWAAAWDANTSLSPVQLGFYTVVGSQPPVVNSIAPASSTGAGAIFVVTLSDPNGASDISGLQFVINTGWDGTNACYLYYLRDAGSVSLADDQISTWTPVRFGSADTAQNSQCAISGTGSSVSEFGNVLSLAVNLTFKPAFAGLRYVYVNAWDRDGLDTGAIRTTWYQVTAGSNRPPVPSQTAPASGSGRGGLFTFSVSDSGGAADISGVQIFINSTFSNHGGCLIYHQRGSPYIALANDAQTVWIQARLGTADTAENSQCTIGGVQSSAVASGNDLVLKIPITFKPAFAGTKGVFVTAWDQANASSGPVDTGVYTVNDPPSVVSVSPNAGAGTSERFQVRLTDPNGGGDIQAAFLAFNKIESAAGGCLIYYERGYTRLFLLNDAGSDFTGVTPGSSETAVNSKCTLKGAGSSFTVSGNDLVLQADLTFQPAGTGAQNMYVAAVDRAGAVLTLVKAGSYTVAGSNSTPYTGSISPGSGSGSALTLTVNLSDGDGAGDISGAQVLISPTLSLTGACLVAYNPSQSTLSVANDAMTAWSEARFGTSEVAQNTACSASASGSSAVASGSGLKLILKINLKAGFTGNKNIYINVWDRSGAGSAFVQKGTWSP